MPPIARVMLLSFVALPADVARSRALAARKVLLSIFREASQPGCTPHTFLKHLSDNYYRAAVKRCTKNEGPTQQTLTVVTCFVLVFSFLIFVFPLSCPVVESWGKHR